MTEVKIALTTINAVKEFVDIVNKYDFESDIAVGKYVIDAKSIMGIFSLDLSKELTLKIHSDNASRLIEEIKKYTV